MTDTALSPTLQALFSPTPPEDSLEEELFWVRNELARVQARNELLRYIDALQACYHVTQGTKCDFLYTPLQEQNMTFVTSWFVAVGLDGRNITASALSVAGSKWEPYPGSLKTFTNVPVRVSALFPVEGIAFPVLTVAGQAMRDIRIGSPAASPVGSSVTPQAATTSTYNAVLTNCKPQTNGVLVCTATLTPRK